MLKDLGLSSVIVLPPVALINGRPVVAAIHTHKTIDEMKDADWFKIGQVTDEGYRKPRTIHPDSSHCHYPPFTIVKMALAKEDDGSEEDISIVEVNCISSPQLPIEEQEWHREVS
jgi:hypothetical protein